MKKFAWSANTGWESFAPSINDGIVINGRFLSGFAWEANTGWIHFGDGSPDNGYAYSNTGSDYGVNLDIKGNISGYAWSANTGWINFGWAGSGNSDRPRVDLSSGELEGYAWSANTGWMNLGSGNLFTDEIERPDSDADGIPDAYEQYHFGALATADGMSDRDGDGQLDVDEARAGTDPNDAGDLLRIVSIDIQNDLSGTLIEFTSKLGRLYTVELSNAVGQGSGWNAAAPVEFKPDNGTTTTRSVTYPENERKFFRVEVSRPLEN